MVLGKLERRIAEHAADVVLRRNEVGRARRALDVFVRRVTTLVVVGIEQCVGRFAGEHELQLPGQILGVLHAAVRTARAEW